jgi:hypothetical protein
VEGRKSKQQPFSFFSLFAEQDAIDAVAHVRV